MHRTPLILWDIDGTLLRGTGRRVSVNAFLRALKSACNATNDLAYPEDAAGKTDTGIALELLSAAAIVNGDASRVLDTFGRAYIAELERERDNLIQDIRVLPGVREILQALQRRRVTQSLLTGNLQPVARLKLACTDLDRYVQFELGAYGSDHHDRTCLVPIVHSRVQQRLGVALRADEIIVVGDTPRDIACARAGGAVAVAVATGNYSRQELEAEAPDAVLDDLADTELVLSTLLP